MRHAVAALGVVLALGSVSSAGATFPGANGGIAFERLASTDLNTGASHRNLWITTSQGPARPLVKLRYMSAVDVSWSPNGRMIAFAADCSFKYRLLCSSVWRMNADGSGLRMLSNGEAQDYCPAWSPSGKQIAFTAFFEGARNNLSGIYVMNVDGTSRTAIDQNELDGCTAWSPDGATIAFTRANRLYAIGANGSGEHAIATNVGRYDKPDWSPDGSRIAFSKRDRNTSRVFIIRADGTGSHPVAHGSSPTWSPDGRMIAFARGGEIYIVNANGGRAVRATRQRMHSAAHPAWQPRPT
jgi:Tol biopolymer transport system component